MRVFVTDGDQRSTLALVRALGQAGIKVTVGSPRSESLAGSSRYCSARVNYPSPLDDVTSFERFLLREMQRGGYELLLAMTDTTTRLLARMRERLAPLVRLAIPDEDRVVSAQDKRNVLLLARRLGIGCPSTFLLDERDRIEEVANQVRYPVVIKPRFSRFLVDEGWVVGGVEYACDPEDLLEKYRASHAKIPFPLVQERIHGEGRGVFLLVWDGRLKAAFCHRRLREKPPWGGPSVYRESIAFDEKLVEKSFCLLQAIGWQGPAMVEFKVDQKDGEPKLMEINGRFWGSLQLAIDAGMNFPVLLYRLATGEDVPAQIDYKVGVKSRWLLGDLDHLLIRLTRPSGQNGLGSDGVSRLRACRDFLKLYEPGMHYEVCRRGDPRPWWHECKSYVRQLVQSAGGRKEAGRAR